MPPIKEYTIKIEESKTKENVTNQLIKELVAMRKVIASGRSIQKDISSEKIGGLLSQAIDGLSKNQKEFKTSIGKLIKALEIKREPSGYGKNVPDPSIELLGKRIVSLSKELKNISTSKKVALVDIETSPIRKGGVLGGKVDFITQVGVLRASLEDILTKTVTELEKQTKKIYIKPPRKLAATKAEYEKIMEPLVKRGVKPIPWEKLEKSGLELRKAMDELAKTIKDAELIVGHNIEQFDIKVLNDAFKSAGTKIDLAAQEYYDTVIAARKKFPKRTTHKLESYEKDMVLAGKEYAGTAHDAAHDILVTTDVMKALADKSRELEAAEGDLNAILLKLSKKINSIFVKASTLDSAFDYLNKEVLSTGKSFRSLEETVPIADESLSNLIRESDKAAEVISNYTKKAFVDIKSVSKIKSSIEATIFKPSTVQPVPPSVPYVYRRAREIPARAGIPYQTGAPSRTISDLAVSLKKLQDNVVKSLQIGMRKGLDILRTEAGEAFQLGRGGREWEVKIVDVSKIKRELRESFGVTIEPEVGTRGVVETYEKAYIKREASYARSAEETASAVYEWLRRYGKEEAVGKSEYIQKLYEEFKSKGDAIIGQLKEDPRLEDLYRSTALQEKAIQHITDQFARVLTVPAAQITRQGTLAFETKYGAERALASFATLTTGLERLVRELKDLGGDTKEYVGYMSKVAKIPLRPAFEEGVESGKLGETLMGRVKELGGKGLLVEGYREAIKLRKVERGETKESIKTFDNLKVSLTELEKEAERLNITALDVANALNQIKFENFYDILNKLYTAGKVPFLEEKARRIMEMDRNLRDVAKVKDELLGVMPLVEPGRPKRRDYDEQVVRIFTKAIDELTPTEQKQHIKDVALIWAEMAENARKVGKSGLYVGKEYLGIPEAKPIDLSDSASAQLTQFNLKFASSLKDLNKTMISASTADIRGLAPFEQFSSISRQMSYAANALAGGLEDLGKLEIPSLVSKRESEMIRAGRYGAGGYGVNVLTELRNTASTFEDQIVISGKLAKAFTEIVKPLVRPAAAIGAGEIGPIEPGYKRISGKGKALLASRLEKEEFSYLLKGVSDRIQEILGVPIRERGRADITRIGEEIENVMRVHRGESIEVQTAKLTETFLNYFGRKLSTRFGTKGVSITPGLPPTEIKEYQDIAKAMAAGLEAKVVPGAGLGFAKIPKSMGELLAELFSEAHIERLFDQKVLDLLISQLEESGNKFIIDLFKDARKGLVTKEEAERQRDIFRQASAAFGKAFGEELPEESMKAMKLIRSRYEKEVDKGELFELRPIEARISARGIAKRGLAPEIMEGIINNLIGSTKGVTVLQDKINNALIASKELNDYLRALGYKPLEDIEGMRKRLKLEGAKIGEIKELEEFEKRWGVYTDSINEFGEKIQSFVAPKFLQTVEEPHIYKGWTEREIGKGIKGERLNFQAFAAYAGIFGAGSSMLKELAESTALTAEEGWELIRALQMIDPALQSFRKSIMLGLKEIPLRELGQFEKRTATLKELGETIFDISKFPAPFKVKMPSTKKGAKEFYEEFYVPGPALRATYPEELMGGKVAPTNISRYLSNLINAAKAVEDIYSAATGEGMSLDDKSMNKFANTIKRELTETLIKTYKEVAVIESKQIVTPANVKLMEGIIDKLKTTLGKQLAPAIYARPALKQGIKFPTAAEAVEAYEKELHTTGAPKIYTKILARIMDMLIGPQPEALRKEEEKISTALKKYRETGKVSAEYRGAYERYGVGGKISFEDVMEKFKKTVEARRGAPTVFDIELEAGNLKEFAEKVGINLEVTVREALERAMGTLSKAKIAYFEELAKAVIGPKHAIEQTFFQRTIPAITGKAISAVTDKTEELKELLDYLTEKKYDVEIRTNLEEIIKKHEEYIVRSKKLGLPVLKEREIGLSPLMAKALKVKTGAGELSNLAELIEKRERMTEGELKQLKLSRDVFVESVRYPFYGTVSVQPHKARLMKGPEAKYAMTVPGAPELDLLGLSKIISKLEEYMYGKIEEEKVIEPGLLQKREVAWAEGTEEGAKRANELTEEIEGLIGIIRKATPTFINMEQKLDYDGDALFVHTGQLEESRKEIGKHFNALGEDITSVRSLFSTFFTAIKESEVKSLSEMAYIFGKKHPKEKGFEWLTKPYIEEEVKHLDVKEVLKSLYTYSPAGGKMKPEDLEYKARLGEWSTSFMEKEILPVVYKKLGGATARESGMEEPGKFEKRVRELTEELIRRKLWEQKYSDAIIGQLYKLHTGQTVEAISRLVRMSEIETGFGRGLAKTGKTKFQPAEEFLQYWPEESAVLGRRPVQEFATRMNEIMRFVIQKGMDEKHAGVKAVGEDILSNVAKKGGARTIWRIMEEEEDQFDDLWDFNKQILKEAQLRLGALPTSELKGELKRFQIGRMSYEDMKKEFETGGGGISGDVPRKVIADALVKAAKEADISKDREQIINEIVEYIDLKAVFEELFRMIKRTAVKGFIEQLKIEVAELPPERRARRTAEIAQAGGYERFARRGIEEQAATKEGISILRYITANLQPLYTMRTRMQTPAVMARRTRAQIEAPEMMLPAGTSEDLKRTYEQVLKTSRVLSRSMEGVIPGAKGGVHSLMVLSALEKRYKDLEKITEVAKRAEIPEDYGKELVEKQFPYILGTAIENVPKLMSDVWNESWQEAGAGSIVDSIDTWVKRLEKVKRMASGKIEELSQVLAIPPLTSEEEYEAYHEFLTQHPEALKKLSQSIETMARKTAKVPEEEMDEVVQYFTDQAKAFLRFQIGMSEQVKRVSEGMRAVPFQKEALGMAFPGYEAAIRKGPVELANEVASREKEGFEELGRRRVEEQKNYQERIEEFWKRESLRRPGEIKEVIETYKEPDIPMTDAGEALQREAVKTVDEISEAVTDAVIRRKQSALRALEAKATAGIEEKKEVPLYKLYRASAFYGGGGYPNVPQEEAIFKQMAAPAEESMLLEATGFRGSAIHRRKQKEFIEKYSEYGQVQVEGLIEDLNNMITGHYDVLYKTVVGEKRLVDIKTIYDPRKFEAIEKIAKEMQEKRLTLNDYLLRIGIQDRELARRLKGYMSQINFYLSKNVDALGELLIVSMRDPSREVKMEIGKFDPGLFKKDIEAVRKSRDKLEGIVGGIGTGGERKKFIEMLPKTASLESLRAAEKMVKELTEGEEKIYSRLSKEYLALYESMDVPRRRRLWFTAGAAVPPGGAGIPPVGAPPTGGGGDDEDEFEGLRRKVEKILGAGAKLNIDEALKLLDALRIAEEEYILKSAEGLKKLAEKYRELTQIIESALQIAYKEGGRVEVERVESIMKGRMPGMGGIGGGTPVYPTGMEIPEELKKMKEPYATTEYLRAMLRKSVKFYDLFGGKIMEAFGSEIEKLLLESFEKGPSIDVAGRISDAIKALPPEKRGFIANIWQYYKKNVGEYFIKQLDELKQSIDEAGTDEEAKKAYDEYEKTLQAFIGNVKRTLGKMSDIYTRRGFGGMREWVSPELAKGAGIYRRPEEIAEIAKQTAAMSGEFQPIMDVLIGDLDPMMIENMLSPLEKIRIAFTMLAKEDTGLKAILEDADLFRRIGDQAVKAWDFDRMVKGITQLRAGLQSWNRMQVSGFGAIGGAEDYTEAQRKNIEETIKYLKQLENMLVPTGGPAGSPLGMARVPGFLSPKEQELLHKRNIALAREYFKLSEGAGGPARGQRFTYRQRIIDPASKQVLKDTAEEFKKLGDASTTAGEKVGVFTHRTEDMIAAFQARKGAGQVFRRVILWGGASTVIWGGIRALQNMVSTVSDVEYGIATLRQVMSPLETDFEHITKAALGFAKQFGQPIQSVIGSMRVFAQQGLAQEEVIERARTSQIAANVSTLSASDATEALTASMKMYGKEGTGTLRFLDAWSQVEARHAITSKDLAQAMMKAAAVAKTSGITFDELNAIVTGIGETSRQTGREIGTALRFVFRRMQAEKGPMALAEIGVSVIGETGDLRRGFDILGDLAGKWGELTNAQRLSIAQAIGGRRHYNSLIILMDHWGDALSTLEDSINSKGAAERRNAIVMETYAKRMQQVRSAAVELQVQFGRLALPVAKTMLAGLKGLLETLANIPNVVKIAALAITSLFVLFSKGQSFVSKFADRFRVLPEILKDLTSVAGKEIKIGLFEVFGKVPKGLGDIETRGLKTLMESTNIGDMESILGKVGYKAAEFGRSWNSMLSEIAMGSVTASEGIGKLFGKFGTLLNLAGVALLGGGPIAEFFAPIVEVAGVAAQGAETAFDKVAKAMGIPTEKLAEWTKGNTDFVRSVGPMVVSLAALTPVAIKAWGSIKRLSLSASDYEKSMAGARRKTSGELQALRDLSNEYSRLDATIGELAKAREPEAKQKALEREEYKSPVLGLADSYKKAQKFGNDLAKSNFTLVESFDEFGNAVLKTNRSLKEHINLLTSAKVEEVAKTEMDVLGKYIEDLTGGKGFAETFKYELKRFVKEIPAVGNLLAKHIAISPSKELDVVRDKMNEILALREKYPMTTAIEPMFKKYYKQLEDARNRFNDTYKSFRKVLADLPTRGLEPVQIRDLLKNVIGEEQLRKGFELMIRIEPKLQIKEMKGKVDWKDIFGTEILKRMYPEKLIDFTAPLTKELLLQGKLLKRTGRAFAGDIVLFTEDVNKTLETSFGKGLGKGFDVAGRQGILKFKEGVGYFVEYVTREMREVKEVPFSAVEKFVDSVFPTITIQERLQDNLAVLTEFLAGAAAGMTGVTEREFKKSFSLGERFFSQIPTTTLLQTTKGWAPGAGYGEMAYKGAGIPRTYKTPPEDLTKRWDEWMQTFWFEPQERLKMLMEPAEKRAMAGEGPGYGMAEDIGKLVDVLKNNQVVIQYRALHEDLMKTLNESNRVLQENIAIEKVRNEYLIQTSGLLKGMPEDLGDINLGVVKFSELTAQQRLLFKERFLLPEERVFTGARAEYREAKMRRGEKVGEIEAVERARVQLREIQATAVGLGAAMSPEELSRVAESIVQTGSKPLGLILNEEKKVVTNTGKIAESMDDLLAQMGDPEAATRRSFRQLGHIEMQTKIVKADITSGSIKGMGERFNYLVKLRGMYEKAGRKDLTKAIDASLNDLSSTLVQKMGMKEAIKVFEKRLPFSMGGFGMPKDIVEKITAKRATPLVGVEKVVMGLRGEFTKKEFIRRAVGDLGLREFTQVLDKYAGKTDKSSEYIRKSFEVMRKVSLFTPGNLLKYIPIPPTKRERVLGSKEYKALEKEMSSQVTVSVTTSKTLQKMFAAYTGYQDIFRRAANREAKYFEVQIKLLEDQRKSVAEQLKVGGVSKKEAKESTLKLGKQITEMKVKREEALTTAEKRAIQEAVGAIATAGMSFARAVGLSEGALKGLGTTAVASMVAWHAWSALTGEPIPDYIKDLGDKAKEAAKKIGKEAPGWAARTWLKVEKMFSFGLGGAIKTVEEEARKKKPFYTEEEKEKIRKIKDFQINEKQLKKTDEMLKGVKKGDVEQLATDKQILNENKQQTDILLGIHEALRMLHEARKEQAEKMDEQKTSIDKASAEQTKTTEKGTSEQVKSTKEEMSDTKAQVSYAKQLRDKIDIIKVERLREGDIGTKIRDILTIALLTATTGYVADVQAFGAELGEYEDKAKKVSGIVVKLVEKFPTEVEKAIEILKEERAERKEKLAKPGLTDVERRSIVADQEKAYEEVGNNLLKLAKRLGEEAVIAGQIMTEASSKMRLLEIAENIEKQMEEMENVIRASRAAQIFENEFVKPLVGALKGIHVPQIEFGRKITDLSPYESLLVGSEKFRKIGEDVEGSMSERAILVSRATSMMEEIEASKYKELSDIEKGYFDLLGEQLDKIKGRINNLNGAIAEGTRKLSEAAIAEEFRLEKLAEAATVLKETALAEARAKISTGVGIQTGISPFAGGIDFGVRTMRELAPIQRAFMENESAFKDYNKRVAKAGAATRIYENLISRRADIEHRISREEEKGGEVSKESKKELKLVNKALKEAEPAAVKAAEALSKLINSMYGFVEAATFQNQIETARINVLQEHARLITKTQLGKPIVGAGIVGGFPEIETGRAPYQLAPTERLLTEAGAEGKKIIMLYQLLQSQRRSEISLLENGRVALIRYNDQLEIAKEKAQDTKGIEEAIDRQIDKNKALEQNIGDLTNELGGLKNIVEAVSFQGLINDLENLKKSFLVGEATQYEETMWDMMRGGRHPKAPVVPTFEMIQAGVPEEELWNMTRHEADMAKLRATGKPISMRDVAEIRFREYRETMMYKQQKENDELMRQRRHGEEILSRLSSARYDAEAKGQTDLVDKIDILYDKMKGMIEIAPEIEEREGELLYYKGFDFTGFFREMKGLAPRLTKDFVNPIKSELEKQTEFLRIIAGVEPEDVEPKEELEHKTVFRHIMDGVRALQKYVAEAGTKRASGGHIFGPGGPREDKVPIWASPHEYIIKASSAKKLGYNDLNYMNKTGQLPTFQEGGEVPEWGRKHPNLYGLMGAGKAAGAALGQGFIDAARMLTGYDAWKDIMGGKGDINDYIEAVMMIAPGLGGVRGLSKGLLMSTKAMGLPIAEMSRHMLQYGKIMTGGLGIKAWGKMTAIGSRATKMFESMVGGSKALLKSQSGFIEIAKPRLSSNELYFDKYIEELIENYPSVASKIRSIRPSKAALPKAELGNIFGGVESRSFDIRLDLSKHKSYKKLKDTFAHEFGHAVHYSVKQASGFFESHGLRMPNSLKNMSNFIEKVGKGREFKFVDEEIADLFMGVGRGLRGSKRLKEYRNIFTPEAFSEDWSKFILDESIKDKYKKIMMPYKGRKSEGLIEGFSKSLGGLMGFQIGGEIVGRKAGEAIIKIFGSIPQYKEGIKYVPRDQLAYLHKGEEVISSRYQDGGQVTQLKINVEGAVEKIESAIEKAIKVNKLEVDFAGVSDEDKRMLPPREIPAIEIDPASITRLSNTIRETLSNLTRIEGNAVGVGADRINEVSEIKELLTNRLSALEEFQISSKEELNNLVVKVNSSSNSINRLEQLVDNLQTKTDDRIKTAEDTSKLEKRMHELINDLENFNLTPMDMRIRTVERLITSMDQNIKDNFDRITSLDIRSGLVTI